MNSKTDLNESYRVLIKRGPVGPNPCAIERKPFIWEIRHKETAQVLRSSAEPFTTMEEAYQSGRLALATISQPST
jgi:hypothetical protein